MNKVYTLGRWCLLMPLFFFAFSHSLSKAEASGDLMTVAQVKVLLNSTEKDQAMAAAYMQGLVEGMLGLASAQAKEQKAPTEFCGFFALVKRGEKFQHPAYGINQTINAWERAGLPMQAPAADLVLSYLEGQFGCD
jgi:hypothetical protein